LVRFSSFHRLSQISNANNTHIQQVETRCYLPPRFHSRRRRRLLWARRCLRHTYLLWATWCLTGSWRATTLLPIFRMFSFCRVFAVSTCFIILFLSLSLLLFCVERSFSWHAWFRSHYYFFTLFFSSSLQLFIAFGLD
jgi:hypothetical protein